MFSEREYQIILADCLSLGPVSLAMLYARLGSWQAIFEASETIFNELTFSKGLKETFFIWRKSFSANKYFEQLERETIKTLVFTDDIYPSALKEIAQPPLVLFYLGDITIFQRVKSLAVVGSRTPSIYGQQTVKTLIPPVASAGLIITSGLAIGIDSLAHLSALSANGLTAAVIGSGLDKNSIYPSSNQRLAQDIIKTGGTIISEFPPETPGLKQNFPRRNRLISGLSKATLVIEAALRSGSLITARFALEQNREVLAVPGLINARLSAGTNNLIKQGAALIENSEDILNIYGLTKKKTLPIIDLTTEELSVFQLFKKGNFSANEVAVLLNLDICVITTALTTLELNGLIKRYGVSYGLTKF